MTKALSWICLVLLVCVASPAWADKPKIAILGLEVVAGAGGVVDPGTTQVAKDITKELRQRAQLGASPYLVAPNSNKELTDEKLLMSCDNEAKDGMAVIGVGLSADMLLYGRVEKKGELYKVQLKLLDVKAKTIEAASDEMLAGAAPAGVSRRLYTKLIGDAPGGMGSVVVAARGDAGGLDGAKVMIDDERKGVLAGGKLTLTGVGEGRHTLAIEAGGYRRFEEAVTVRGGQVTKLDAQLVGRDAVAVSGSTGSNKTAWKVAFGASLAVVASGAGLAVFSFVKANNNKGEYRAVDATMAAQAPDQDDCDKTNDQLAMTKNAVLTDRGVFDTGCTWNKRVPIGLIIGGVGVVAAVTSLIMLTRDSGAHEKVAGRPRHTRPQVAVTPIVAPSVAGASLSLQW